MRGQQATPAEASSGNGLHNQKVDGRDRQQERRDGHCSVAALCCFLASRSSRSRKLGAPPRPTPTTGPWQTRPSIFCSGEGVGAVSFHPARPSGKSGAVSVRARARGEGLGVGGSHSLQAVLRLLCFPWAMSAPDLGSRSLADLPGATGGCPARTPGRLRVSAAAVASASAAPQALGLGAGEALGTQRSEKLVCPVPRRVLASLEKTTR